MNYGRCTLAVRITSDRFISAERAVSAGNLVPSTFALRRRRTLISSTWSTRVPEIPRPQEPAVMPPNHRSALDTSEKLIGLTCLVARLILRLSLWLSALTFRHSGRTNGPHTAIRMVSALGLRALVGCATGFGCMRQANVGAARSASAVIEAVTVGWRSNRRGRSRGHRLQDTARQSTAFSSEPPSRCARGKVPRRISSDQVCSDISLALPATHPCRSVMISESAAPDRAHLDPQESRTRSCRLSRFKSLGCPYPCGVANSQRPTRCHI